ncbi:MAG TPA: DNA mismatch repair protein MutS [Polyangiaceae bacterium]
MTQTTAPDRTFEALPTAAESAPQASPEFYRLRASAHRAERERLERRSRWLSNFRGVSFATCILSWGWALFGSAGSTGVNLGGVALVAFLGLVVYHARVIAAEGLSNRRLLTNEDAAARVTEQAWHQLPIVGERFREPNHPYADDLDLFGTGSLFQRLCVAQTQLGQSSLARLLLHPTEPTLIRERQTLVRGLAPLLDFRQEFEVLARATLSPGQSAAVAEDLEPLFAWGEAKPTKPVSLWLVGAARVMPVVTTLVIGLGYLSVIPRWLGLLPLFVHLLLLLRARTMNEQLKHMLAKSERTVLAMEALFRLLESEPRTSQVRTWLDARLKATASLPSVACQSLRRIAGWFELRHSGMVYPFIDLYLIWDLQCAIAFDAWRTEHGKKLRNWFALVGEMEALNSLAGFHFDEPASCFAEVVTEAVFEAEQLGHPLIDPRTRVSNDVSAIHSGHAMLVTGSNMSGKSTFLRAMGLGAVMGLAGGPVCAKRLRLSPVTIATSMRIADSLAGGVSHFYAELAKLRAVLLATNGERPVLFLLDEILHGTNSRERRIGARWMLGQLLRVGAIGAVSTHDLALCELRGELAERLALVHFRENVEGNAMSFDYLVRPGPVTAGNALRLMRSLGLDVPLEDEMT